MPVVATRANAGAGGYGWSSVVAESLDGMVLITPTSVDKAGTSSTATIGANGSVTFSACTSLSLNGVFTSDYDNYMIIVRQTDTLGTVGFMRLRASGTDNSTASSYTYQSLSVSGSTVSGARTTTNQTALANDSATLRIGYVWYLYGPYLAQPTAGRSVSMADTSSAAIGDYAFTHNQSSSYDGITLIPKNNITGLVSVYGLEN